MTIDAELQEIAGLIDKAEQLINEKKGAKKEIEKQLVQFNCKTLDDINDKLNQLDTELEANEKQFESAIAILRKETAQLRAQLSLEN